MGWDEEKTILWWQTKNPLCGNVSPISFLILRPEKCKAWIEALISGEEK